MADVEVTITIPDAHVARVSAATGATTKAQFQNWVRSKVKRAVVSYETQIASEAENEKIRAAETARTTAVDAAVAAAEEITLA